jgi:hypothetical protein
MGTTPSAALDDKQMEIVNQGVLGGYSQEEITAELGRYAKWKASDKGPGDMYRPDLMEFKTFGAGPPQRKEKDIVGPYAPQPTDTVGGMAPQPTVEQNSPLAPQPQDTVGPYAKQDEGTIDKSIGPKAGPVDVPPPPGPVEPKKPRTDETDYFAITEAYRRRQKARQGYAGKQTNFGKQWASPGWFMRPRFPTTGPLLQPGSPSAVLPSGFTGFLFR